MRAVLTVVVALLACAVAALEDARPALAAGELPAFRRGINLARLHSLPTEDPATPGAFLWPPFQGPLAEISDAELVRLKAVGFDFVRLPVAPAPFLSVSAPEQRILIDQLYDTVKRLQAAGFGVLVDAHPNHHDVNWSAPAILANAEGEAFHTYTDWLKQLARYMRLLPRDKVALGLMNEPQEECHLPDTSEWTRMQPLLYASVREVAPDLAIVLTTGCWSSPDALPHLDMGPYDANTLVDVHYYRPHIYTHQGLPFANVPTRYISGLAYPGPGADKVLSLERSADLIKQRRSDGGSVPQDAWDQVKAAIDNYYDDPPAVDRAYIEGHFAAMRAWTEAQNIAPERLIIGEFGSARPPEGMPDIPGRYLWLTHVRMTAEAEGFGWAFWDYNAGDGYPGFGLVFDNESRRIDPDVVNALGLDPEALRD